jgi:hypothetical protein
VAGGPSTCGQTTDGGLIRLAPQTNGWRLGGPTVGRLSAPLSTACRRSRLPVHGSRGAAETTGNGSATLRLQAVAPLRYRFSRSSRLFWKSSEVFVCGNAMSGTAIPKAEQIGSHPSCGCQSMSRSPGTSARTAALCAA